MKIHFIGIGGIGLSALAKYLKQDGHIVTGSDIRRTKITETLEKKGIPVTVPHSPTAIVDQDLVIYSAAIRPENVEMMEARVKGINLLSRSEALPFILAFKKVYSVCGAHGKSTTTAMLAAILGTSALIGAESKEFGSNTRRNSGDLMVFEADESDGSFLNSNPYCAIVTNAEPEHMEYYKYDLKAFYGAYTKFLDLAKIRVINAEDPFLAQYEKEAIRLYPSRQITNIRYSVVKGEPTTFFDLEGYGSFEVWGFGKHIALDASLAILAALHEMPLEAIRENLKRFKGIKKRFDIIHSDERHVIIDDYGHHPTEIEATLASAKTYAEMINLSPLSVIWQPHKWSRTMDNLEHFKRCFSGCDRLIILPVWAVNEEPRELDWQAEFGHYQLMLADRVVREGSKLKIIKDDSVIGVLDEGVTIGFGAGDITYQLRGEG
ncbi:MAG: UDP-N-acetylmuramate--L-alanine ligase [Campylobacterales bacterium]